ncbi:MAG TPA: DUF1592 domain-containing protein [Verrucomicrobiales bacterium]|nr:DUF1592 domain-containing protein [Verrucomicrobiales bacterium]
MKRLQTTIQLLLMPGALAIVNPAAEAALPASISSLVESHCLDCHDPDVSKGGLDLTTGLSGEVALHSELWEKVVRRLRTRQMPPASKKSRPGEDEYESTVAALNAALDAAAAARPRPGRTETVRRLTRTEYGNAIRDLLALEVDAVALLPADEVSYGFDNVTVGTLSPALLDRYITAAQTISRQATGSALREPGSSAIRVRPDITQEERVEGLPFGTRGGTLIRHTFSRDGEYEIKARLARDRNEEVEGLTEPHELLVLLDRKEVGSFTVRPPRPGQGHAEVDAHLEIRLPVEAGLHELGITFVKNPTSLHETLRQPYEAHFNFHRHPRTGPAVYQVGVTGPYDSEEPGDSPSRRRIFVAEPVSPEEEEDCARTILANLLRRAWRRPVNGEDVERVLPFFREGRESESFDAGIEAALSAVLVSREFLFRVETDPEGLQPGTPYPVSDIELASRLSFFLWSSIPDDELLALAERGELTKPEVMEKQALRMLADPRATALAHNFGGQWLHLRNLDAITPDGRLFPGFDDNLRQAFRRETELLFEEILREDRSVLGLLRSRHGYLNERLAKHYGVPHVYGSHFRRVSLAPEDQRGGLLRQGSILTVTSYATRTSPVLRGKWILENLIGTPPSPPLPDVPALDENTVSANLPVRERLAQHRANAACASCHEFIDPPGFALEHFDAVGRWRMLEEGQPVDASGGLPDGSVFAGADGLEEGLLHRPEIFVNTLVEKLLVFCLGRGVEPYDGPAVRAIVRGARDDEYRISAIIGGIVRSVPFRMRESS